MSPAARYFIGETPQEESAIARETTGIEELVAIMARLRAPDGCPWDRQQTLETLRSYLLEETYEVLEAMEVGEARRHCEELGDLLFQIVFQCQLANEAGRFGFTDVVAAISKKIVRRHPHVFGGAPARTSAEVVDHWERIKQQEKRDTGEQHQSVLAGVPEALPALLRAHRLSERAARVGFDWKDARQIIPKVEEELSELLEALSQNQGEKQSAAVAWELGDLLFSLSNLARHLGFSAEDLLREANRRFSVRFQLVEKLARERGIEMKTASIDDLEALWIEAKATTGQS